MPKFKQLKSRTQIFRPPEILDLVADYGQTVKFCSLVEINPSDSTTGIPSQKRLACRNVRGFVRVDGGQQIKVNQGLNIDASGYTAYIYGGDLKLEQITRDSMIAFEGLIYHLYLIQAHGDKESEIWLELRLIKTKSGTTVEQPDEIIESSPLQPDDILDEPSLQGLDPLFQP
jgi:hypothetical protein